jgi:hypothetical protein
MTKLTIQLRASLLMLDYKRTWKSLISKVCLRNVTAKLAFHSVSFEPAVANRSRALRAQAQDEAAMIRRELDIQLMKIPKRARSLTVNEFVADFSGNLLLASAVKPTPSNILVDNSSSTVTTTNNVSVVAATPARTAKFAL